MNKTPNKAQRIGLFGLVLAKPGVVCSDHEADFYGRPTNATITQKPKGVPRGTVIALTLAVFGGGLAHGADLPVTEPVEYVRICDAYGAGFHYIPGTETCLRISGFARGEIRYVEPSEGNGAGVDIDPRPGVTTTGVVASTTTRFSGQSTRDNNVTSFRARAELNFDARTATEYGTLRSLIRLRFENTTGIGSRTTLKRAFIEYLGFTAGDTQSFFDFYTGKADLVSIDQHVSDKDLVVFAYSANFGNGFSARLSLEDGTTRRKGITSIGTGAIDGITGYAGQVLPDIVGALRVSQGWGSAQIMAVIHQVRVSDLTSRGAAFSSKYGYAFGGGFETNKALLNGFSVFGQAVYSKGALDYASLGTQVNGVFSDAVLVGATGAFDLTTAWSAAGGFSYSVGRFELILEGSIVDVDYSASAAGTPADWRSYNILSNLVYRPVKNLKFILGAGYEKADYGKTAGNLLVVNGAGASPDVDIWEGLFRVQRDF